VKGKTVVKKKKPGRKIPSSLSMSSFKTNSDDKAIFREKAKKYTNGNVSDWLRKAGREYDPGAGDDFY